MSPILKYLLSSFLLVSVCHAQIQQNRQNNNSNAEVPDSVRFKKAKKQTVPKSFYIPTGIRVGTDLVAFGVNAFGENRQRYELHADIDFHRLYLAGSFGTSNYELSGAGFDYSHSGNYYRIGVDANFLKYDPDYNTFTVGFRIARANFSEQLINNQTDSIFGAYSNSYNNPNVSARWFELTTGLRVMVWKNFYTGYTFRIQMSRKIINAENFRSYDIPGFGKAQFNSRWTFNYYLMYRISWKKKGIMPRTN